MRSPTAAADSTRFYDWHWQGQPVQVAYHRQGQGTPILLLPAFSTVSSRTEWHSFTQSLANHYAITELDWPGFGDSSKSAALAYRPTLYESLLPDLVQGLFTQPLAVVAAGHSAGYALQLAHQLPKWITHLILIAPTWRGPLPTMGVPTAIAQGLEQLVKLPLLGQGLYYFNTRPSFLKWMYRRHVFAAPERLTSDFIQQKYRITQQPNARFGPAAFVTGGLDPVTNRGAFLQLFAGLKPHCLVLTSTDAPPKSKAEMEAIATLPKVQVQPHPGSLGLHEEYGAELASLVQSFLLLPG